MLAVQKVYMHINVTKCELISNDISPTIVPLDQFVHVKRDVASLLGAPLLPDKALDKALEKKYDVFKRASELDYLLPLLHTVVTGYMYYRFHPVDYVLTTTLLYRVAIGLRLGANLCDPHVCSSGTFANSRGTHGLSCKRGSS